MTLKFNEEMVLYHLALGTFDFKEAKKRICRNDFPTAPQKELFETLDSIDKRGEKITPDSFVKELIERESVDAFGGEQAVRDLISIAQSVDFEEEYLAFKEKSVLRQIAELSKGDDPASAIVSIKRAIEEIPTSSNSFSHLLKPISKKDIVDEILNISPGARVGMKIGEIDLKIPGGALTIVALPTGHGKTLLMINMILNFLAIYPDKKVFFFSYEESRAAIVALFLNTFVNRELSKNNRESIKSYFRDGSPNYIAFNMREEFLAKEEEFFKTLIEPGLLNILYCEYAAEELADALRFLKKKVDVGLIAIDYMQMLRLQNEKNAPRQEELKAICQVAKNCAVDTGLPIIIAAQFNRTVVDESTISPIAIGEAGDIERAANMVIGGWNRNYDGFTKEGNKTRDGNKAPKESAIFLEILKGREIGIGHSTVMNLNGRTGKLTPKTSSPQWDQDQREQDQFESYGKLNG